MSGRLTEKSDVFFFGVILLELITGRKPIDSSRNYLLVKWVSAMMLQFSTHIFIFTTINLKEFNCYVLRFN